MNTSQQIDRRRVDPRQVDRRQVLRWSLFASAGAAALKLGAGPGVWAAASLAPAGVNLFDLGGSIPEPGQGVGALGAWGGHANGRIPAAAMSSVPVRVGQPCLRADAAAAYHDLSAAFRARFGSALSITEAYRDYPRQQALWEAYQHGGNLAARPGTSVHGWGLACDFGSGVASYGTPQKQWMDSVAPRYGWQPIGNVLSQREPWHFEFDGSYQVVAPPAKKPLDLDMRLIQAGGRGIAVIGPNYIHSLTAGEFVDQAVLLWGSPVIGNDRQFDVWRSIATQGQTA